MSLDWHKANNPRVLAFRDLRIAEGRKATEHEGWSETLALLAVGRLDRFAFATYARSLGWDRGRLKRRLADWVADVDAQLVNMTPPWWCTAPIQSTTASSEHGAQQTHSKRTGDAPHARSFLEKKKETKKENAAPAAEVSGHESGSDKAQQTKALTAELQRLATLRSSIRNGQGALTEAAKTTKPAKPILDQYRKLRDRGITEDGIAWLIRWALLAPDDGKPGSAHYLRSKGYTSMKNLLVDGKADDRIEKARTWFAAGCTLAGPHVANVDEGVLKRKAARKGPQARPDEIPADDMVAVVLDIARQLREGTRPLAVSWPRWLDVLDDRRVKLTAHVMQRPADVATIDDPSKAASLLEAA
jgi:hypothetical protein